MIKNVSFCSCWKETPGFRASFARGAWWQGVTSSVWLEAWTRSKRRRSEGVFRNPQGSRKSCSKRNKKYMKKWKCQQNIELIQFFSTSQVTRIHQNHWKSMECADRTQPPCLRKGPVAQSQEVLGSSTTRWVALSMKGLAQCSQLLQWHDATNSWMP